MIYGDGLFPLTIGPSPDNPPDEWEYLTSHLNSATSDSWYYNVPETNWYQIHAIGVGGKGGTGGDPDIIGTGGITGGGGGGGGHGGYGIHRVFLEEGQRIGYAHSSTAASIAVTGLSNATVRDGLAGSSTSGTSGGKGGTGGTATGFNFLNIEGGDGDNGGRGSNWEHVGASGEDGAAGGWGGVISPEQKYSFGKWGAANYTPPNLNLGNGASGGQGDGIRSGGSGTYPGSAPGAAIKGGIVIEKGVY